jgi:hypothetical protein
MPTEKVNLMRKEIILRTRKINWFLNVGLSQKWVDS